MTVGQPLPDYLVEPYRPEHIAAVAVLIGDLTGRDAAANTAYLRWKYHENPAVDRPLGVVALAGGEAVGFRGYLASRWRLPRGAGELAVLGAGDTVVHPAHRRRGLSVRLGRAAMAAFSGEYRVLLNTTCTAASLPGYRTLGFHPLAPRRWRSRHRSLALARYLFAVAARTGPRPARFPLGRRGAVLVTDHPLPREMAAALLRQRADGDRIAPLQDEEFFRWRFHNPFRSYLFWYLMDHDDVTAFVAVGLSPHGRRGYIMDTGAADDEALSRLLLDMVTCGDFDVLSALDVTLPEPFSGILDRLSFRRDALIGRLERRLRGEYPLLVRPLAPRPGDGDWQVGGLDLRRAQSWRFKAICADDA